MPKNKFLDLYRTPEERRNLIENALSNQPTNEQLMEQVLNWAPIGMTKKVIDAGPRIIQRMIGKSGKAAEELMNLGRQKERLERALSHIDLAAAKDYGDLASTARSLRMSFDDLFALSPAELTFKIKQSNPAFNTAMARQHAATVTERINRFKGYPETTTQLEKELEELLPKLKEARATHGALEAQLMSPNEVVKKLFGD